MVEQQGGAPEMLDPGLALLDERHDHRIDRRRPPDRAPQLHHLAVQIIDLGLASRGEVVGHRRAGAGVDRLDLEEEVVEMKSGEATTWGRSRGGTGPILAGSMPAAFSTSRASS